MSLPKEERDAIRERAEKATPGPWTWEHGHTERRDPRPAVILHFDYDHGEWFIHGDLADIADAEFIAHAREDIPRLLNDMEDAEKEIKRLENELRYWQVSAIDRLNGLQEERKKLVEALRSAYGRAKVFHQPGKSTRPTKSAVAACSWIAEELAGVLKELGYGEDTDVPHTT